MEEINGLLAKIGDTIVKLRKQKGIKQIDLAVTANIDDGSLRRIEEGLTNPTIKTLSKIAKGLDIDISELFDTQKESIISNPENHIPEDNIQNYHSEEGCIEYLKKKGYLVFKAY